MLYEVITGFVADGKVLDQQSFTFHGNPETGHIFASFAESLHNLFNHMHALFGVAVMHIAANNGFGAREDPLLRGREILHPVVLVDKSEIDRQVVKQQLDLLEAETSASQVERSGGAVGCWCGGACRLGLVKGKTDVEALGQEGLQLGFGNSYNFV